jgi:prepilin-type N-terminal cleavage/methylation domain-containing protein
VKVHDQNGFSLIELAIGLVIMGLIAVGVISSLSAQTEQRRTVQTREMLIEVRNSLMSFVTTQGRLPCPASLLSDGQESIASNSGGIITCSSENGFVPGVTLGLAELDARGLKNDAWDDGPAGNSPRTLRYAVSNLQAPVANALTSPGLGAPASSTRRLDVQSSIAANQSIFICKSASAIAAAGNRCLSTTNTLSSNAAFVLWSAGPNGRDTSNFSADEQQNMTWAVPRVLISREFAPLNASGGGFDDLLLWQPFSLVAERLFSGGFVQ